MSLIRKLLRWDDGRQNSGYEKMLLCFAYWPIKFDIYLLRFKVGSEIPPHVDPIASGKHYRLNIILKSAIEGGDFICIDPIYESKRIKLFRPDMSEHRVTRIIQGSRYLLSIGWVKDT